MQRRMSVSSVKGDTPGVLVNQPPVGQTLIGYAAKHFGEPLGVVLFPLVVANAFRVLVAE